MLLCWKNVTLNSVGRCGICSIPATAAPIQLLHSTPQLCVYSVYMLVCWSTHMYVYVDEDAVEVKCELPQKPVLNVQCKPLHLSVTV